MKLHHTFLLCAAVLTAVLTAGPSHAAENKSAPNAQAMLNNMRLKQLTKALELTTEQQAKVKALYESESEQIAKIDAAELPIAERTDKVTAVKKETQSKIKALLTAEQAEKYEKMNARPERKKKAAN